MITVLQGSHRPASGIAAASPSLSQAHPERPEAQDEELNEDFSESEDEEGLFGYEEEFEEEEDLVLMPDGPIAQLGAMHLTDSSGCGVGFVASHDIREGEVLLVSPALFPPLSGFNRTQPPSGLDLANHMSSQQPVFSPETQQWLRLLHVGSSGDAVGDHTDDSQSRFWPQHEGSIADNGQQTHSRLSRLERLLPSSIGYEDGNDGTVSHSEGFSIGSSAEGQVLPLLDWAAITAMVNFNSYADVGEDAAVVMCRGQDLTDSPGFAGMWGSFSLLNHSCSPNASYLVINQQMVVHAARSIPDGEEVSINYFGARVLQPVEERRKYLQENYGFQCRCPRCQFESSLSKSTREQITGSANTAGMMGEVLEEGGRRGDEGIYREVQAMLGNYQDEIHKLGDRLRVTDQQRFWIQASAYPIYEGVLRLRTHALQQQQALSVGSSSSSHSPTDGGSSGSSSTRASSSGANATSTPEHSDKDPGMDTTEEGEEDETAEQQPQSPGRVTGRRRGTVYQQSKSRGQNPGTDPTSAAAREASRARALLLRCLHEEVEAIDFCMEAVAEVARGSDLHVSLAEQRLRAAETAFVGADRASPAMMEAERCCYDAWCTRYGQLSFEGYTRLLAAKRNQ